MAIVGVLVAALPQWWVIGVGPGFKVHHLLGLCVIAVVLVSPADVRQLERVVRCHKVMLGAFVIFLLVAIAAIPLHSVPFISGAEIVRHGFHLALSLAVAALVAGGTPSLLARSGLIIGLLVPAAFLAVVWTSLASRGVAWSTLAALVASDPLTFVRAVLLDVLRTDVTGLGSGLADASANLRHGVMNAILASMSFMQATAPSQRGRVRALVRVTACCLASLSIISSFSRSVIIELGLALLVVAGLRTMAGDTVRYAALGVMVVVGGLVTLGATGLGDALLHRFVDDTGSYEARAAALEGVLDDIGRGFWWGLSSEHAGVTTSAHVFPLEVWRATGLLGLVAASLFTIALVAAILDCLGRALRTRTAGGLDLAWVVVLALIPLVRLNDRGRGPRGRGTGRAGSVHGPVRAGPAGRWRVTFRRVWFTAQVGRIAMAVECGHRARARTPREGRHGNAVAVGSVGPSHAASRAHPTCRWRAGQAVEQRRRRPLKRAACIRQGTARGPRRPRRRSMLVSEGATAAAIARDDAGLC